MPKNPLVPIVVFLILGHRRQLSCKSLAHLRKCGQEITIDEFILAFVKERIAVSKRKQESGSTTSGIRQITGHKACKKLIDREKHISKTSVTKRLPVFWNLQPISRLAGFAANKYVPVNFLLRLYRLASLLRPSFWSIDTFLFLTLEFFGNPKGT